MNVRLTQIDGKLPNLALMKLAHWHRARGDYVHFTRRVYPELFEPQYDRVYASAIFSYSLDKLQRFREQWPGAIVGGTGTSELHTVESITGPYEKYDYADYPEYPYSLGFLQRGCRLKCRFCVVPTKEGKPSQNMTVSELWRGGEYPKKLHILDNDFFGVPGWQQHVKDINDGGFKVCLNQGINVRLIHDEGAEALASMEYRDDQFQQRRIYTAWDNIGDEKIFMKGIDTLERAGIPAKHVMAYMLIGYDPKENWPRLLHRYNRMRERGVSPYPMVFENKTYPGDNRTLKQFQRWAIRLAQSGKITWDSYDPKARAA